MEQRVAKLESDMKEVLETHIPAMKEKQDLLVDNTDEILSFMKGAKTWTGRAMKFGPHILTAAVTAGLITGKAGAFLTAIIS